MVVLENGVVYSFQVPKDFLGDSNYLLPPRRDIDQTMVPCLFINIVNPSLHFEVFQGVVDVHRLQRIAC